MICRTQKELIDLRPCRAFISYAQVEEPWKTRLLEAFAPLQSDGFVEIWHDGMLLPGEPWQPKLLSALADAELILLLVSPAFLESNYAREMELPLALERANIGRSRLVPIILKSCDWTKHPFAKYQALPGDRMPIAQRSDIENALKDCVERLRKVFHQPDAAFGDEATKAGRPVPLLGVTFDFTGSDWPNWSTLIEGVRKIARNGEVRTNFARQLSAGNRWEWMLEGPSQAFSAIEGAHAAGGLSDALGVEVISVARTVGASYFAGTYLVDAGEAPPPIDRMLAPGTPCEPPRLFGIAVRPSDPNWVLPFFTKSGNEIPYEDWQREKQKLLGYFNVVLAVPGEDMHVNLSGFTKGQMMPANLARTDLGRVLAEQDCQLKRLTASLLHPRRPGGCAFWERVETLAREAGKRGSLEMWQKVWIVAGSATMNEKAAGERYDHPLPPGYEIRPEDWFGHLSECSLRVMCETDYLALEKRSEQSQLSVGPADPFHEQAMDVFRETILPELEVEVNKGSHFAPLRQVYDAVALAKWYRERVAGPGMHTRLLEVAAQMRAGLGDATEIGPGSEAPEWMNECHARYMDLLDGVFLVSQSDPDAPRKKRVYQSGGVSL